MFHFNSTFCEIRAQGRLASNTDLRQSSSGNVFLSNVLVYSVRYKKDEVWEERTKYLPFACFGKTAEIMSKFTSKGDLVAIKGAVEQYKEEKGDEEESNTYRWSCIANSVALISRVGSGKREQEVVTPSERSAQKGKEEAYLEDSIDSLDWDN